MNAHILEYLEYYISLSNPMFAVMIDGEWGAGKTTLIRRFLKENKHTHAYVSLYGARTGDDIAERLFVAKHPILGSRGFTVAGRILKGLLKASFKIDLDGKIVDDVTSTPAAPDPKDLQDYAQDKQTSSHQLVVFDDLERCPAKSEMWGFINRLVEHEGARVLLLSAEDKMNSEADYRTTKEKNVGITFRVEPDVDGVINTLAQESGIVDSSSFTRFRAQIIDIFRKSGCKSLRVLRFAMRDFSRLLKILSDNHRNRHEVIQALLAPLFTLAFGVYRGAIRPIEITELLGVWVRGASHHRNIGTEHEEHEAHLREFVAKHREDFSFLTITPDLAWWRTYFEHGLFHKEELEQAIDARFPLVDNRPNWLKLANFSDLTDTEFCTLVDITRKELERGEYRHPGEILHVAGVHIWAARQRLINDDISAIISTSIAAIENLEPDDLQKDYDWMRPDRFYRSHGGVIYAGTEDEEFQKLTEHVEVIIAQDTKARLKLAASQLSSHVTGRGVDFMDALGFGDATKRLDPLVLSESFLQFIDQELFIKELLELDAHGQSNVISGISMRINQRHDALERKWISEVVGLVEAMPPSLRRYFVLLQLRRCLHE